MKILRIIPSMNPKQGGPCQGIRNSIPEMRKQGVENEVLCFDTSDAEYLGTDDFQIHAIGPSSGPYAYCPALKPWLEENIARYDIIIIHGLWLHHSYGTYKVWKSYKKKTKEAPRLYIMPHGMLDPYFQKAKDRRLKAIRNWFFWKLIEKKVLNGCDGVLFTCEEELLLARKTFTPYHPQRELNVGYAVLPPPIYSDEMTQSFSEKCDNWNGKPFLLFLSRIHEKKGTDLLIKAYLRIKASNKDIPQLVIAGPGLDTAYGQKMMKLAKGEDILFPGMLSGDAKWGAFYNSEVFILPSHQENFGIAIVEAMACQKAVLITDKVNIWREIENNNAGLIAQDCEDDIFEMLRKWLSLSQEKKIEMGSHAEKAYENFFSIEGAVRKMISDIKGR